MASAPFPFNGGPHNGTTQSVKDNDCPFVGMPAEIGYDVYVANADHAPTAYEYAGFAINHEHMVELAAKVRPR